MRLFHVSEESDIEKFVPRIPYRKDVDQSKGLVWALGDAIKKTSLKWSLCRMHNAKPRLGKEDV
jgi:hypothetical protein